MAQDQQEDTTVNDDDEPIREGNMTRVEWLANMIPVMRSMEHMVGIDGVLDPMSQAYLDNVKIHEELIARCRRHAASIAEKEAARAAARAEAKSVDTTDTAQKELPAVAETTEPGSAVDRVKASRKDAGKGSAKS